MILGVVIGSLLLMALLLSVALVVRDVRRLHHKGKGLTERPTDAGGVSAAGMTVIGNNLTH